MAEVDPVLEFEQQNPRKIDKAAMRYLNAIRILSAVRRFGPTSRASLAKQSGLSPPAVSALVDDLIVRKGLLREIGQGVSSGGRRPTLITFAADRGCVVGIDLGSTTLRYALADLNGQILARHSEPTRDESPSEVFAQLREGIRTLFTRVAACPPLFAIGIGAPGMTDVRRGIVIEAANLRGWTNVPLREMVAKEFGVAVAIDNDVNMAALGEHWRGCAQEEDNFIFVALGRGVGAGLMIDGRLHRGSHWYAGEISHLLLEHARWQQHFGAQGYLEHHLGAAAIAERVGGLSEVRLAGGDAAALFAAARDGNDAAAKIVTEFATLLGVAVANLVTTLDPALVVLGGGIGQAGEQLLGPLRTVVARVVQNQPIIRTTALGDDAQLFGGLLSALRLANRALCDGIAQDAAREVRPSAPALSRSPALPAAEFRSVPSRFRGKRS